MEAMHGNTSVMTMVTRRASGGTANDAHLPGGCLDPAHTALGGASTTCWLGTGTVEAIALTCEGGQDVEVSVHDATGANGRPLAIAGLPRYTIAGASASATRPGLGRTYPNGQAFAAGAAIMDVRIPSWPAAIVANSLRWRVPVRFGTVRETIQLFPRTPCLRGMVVRVQTAGVLGAALDIAITYRPHVLGLERLQHSMASAVALPPGA